MQCADAPGAFRLDRPIGAGGERRTRGREVAVKSCRAASALLLDGDASQPSPSTALPLLLLRLQDVEVYDGDADI